MELLSWTISLYLALLALYDIFTVLFKNLIWVASKVLTAASKFNVHVTGLIAMLTRCNNSVSYIMLILLELNTFSFSEMPFSPCMPIIRLISCSLLRSYVIKELGHSYWTGCTWLLADHEQLNSVLELLVSSWQIVFLMFKCNSFISLSVTVISISCLELPGAFAAIKCCIIGCFHCFLFSNRHPWFVFNCF